MCIWLKFVNNLSACFLLFLLQKNVQNNSNQRSEYEALLALEDGDNYVPNAEPFTCVCKLYIDQGMGIKLRECLHIFCKECIRTATNKCNSIEVMCPYVDPDEGSPCEFTILHRDLLPCVSPEEFNRFISESIQLSTPLIDNAVKCITENCSGFGIVEQYETNFICVVCNVENPIESKVRNIVSPKY